VVLIKGGTYFENLIITKAMTLKPLDENDDVIILAMKHPTLTVKLEKDKTLHLDGIKLGHTGNNFEMCIFYI
jgi:hypothetical protein